jgi:hypothetical protein
MAHELTISVGLITIGMVGIVLVFGVCAVLLRDAFGDRREPRRPPS